MWHRIYQAGRTYWTRPAFWWLGGFAALSSAPIILQALTDPKHDPNYLDHSFMMPTIAIAFLIPVQSKQQFAHPRSRLMPGFTAPHLFWTVVGIVIAVVGLPLISAYANVMHPIPTICWTSWFVASLVWAAHYNSVIAALCTLAIMMSLAIDAGGLPLWGFGDTYQAESVPLHLWPMLIVAWGAIVAWLVRLAQQHEECREYDIQARLANWKRTPRAARLEGRSFRLTERTLSWRISRGFVDWWHNRIALRTARGTASRTFLWQYGFLATPGYIRAVWMAVVLLVMGMFMGAFARPHPNYGTMMMLTSFTIFFPSLMGHAFLVQRWPRLGTEMLLPHTREQWIGELLRALFRETAVGFAAMLLMALATCLVWFPDQVTFGAVVGFLLVASSAVYLGAATAIAIASRYRDLLGNILCSVTVMPLMGIVALWLCLRDTGDFVAALLAVPIIFVGWQVMRIARRRWLDVELGA